MKKLDIKLVRDLATMRGQAIAIALVAACGVAAFVSMRSTYNSLLASQQAYYHAYRFADVFVQLKRAPESVARRIAEIPGVASVQPRVVRDVVLDVPGLSDPATGRLVSIPGRRAPMLNDVFLRSGRYIQAGAQDEVLASEAFVLANKLKLGDSVAAVINGRWQRLRIVGVALSPEYIYAIRGGGSLFPDDRRFGILWMDREVLGPAFNMEDAFNDVAVRLAPRANESSVIYQVDDLLKPYGGLGAYGRADQISHRFISDEIAQNRITATVIPVIFMSVAAILVNLVLSRLVATQRPQVAVLKSFGYSNFSIAAHYTKFALAIASFGVVIGAAVGWYFGAKLVRLYADFYRFPVLQYDVRFSTIAAAVVITAVAATAGALLAAYRAFALPPAEGMRAEAPARYRLSLIERLGLRRLLPLSIRMIARNIARRPLRAALSSSAIACSVAIVVIEFGLFDSMDTLIDLQFRHAQREDVTVVLNEPHASATRFELTRLPGVIRSEPFREVPARLRFQHRSRRIAIQGYERPALLRRITDMKLQETDVPPDGVLLTTMLAQVLGVGPGDSVTVEALEGTRPIRLVRVVGVVDEPLGMSAYMDAHVLHRLMGEGANISGAFLAINQDRRSDLYSRLKRLPAVAGVALRKAALDSFNETISRSIGISLTTLIVFACVIAAGVVYNSGRVAASERAVELASLRILGFTSREITTLLLGEQAVLVVLSIPLGCALGYLSCALLSALLQTELYRLPLAVSNRTYVYAIAVVITSAIVSGFWIRRRLERLDLIAVLKARE